MKIFSIAINVACLLACTILFAQSNYTNLAEFDQTTYEFAMTSVMTSVMHSAYFVDVTMLTTGTNSTADFVESMIDNGMLTNMVKRMASEGYICSVLGHIWEHIPHVTLEYRPNGGYPSHRKCRVCSETQIRKMEEWKSGNN